MIVTIVNIFFYINNQSSNISPAIKEKLAALDDIDFVFDEIIYRWFVQSRNWFNKKKRKINPNHWMQWWGECQSTISTSKRKKRAIAIDKSRMKPWVCLFFDWFQSHKFRWFKEQSQLEYRFIEYAFNCIHSVKDPDVSRDILKHQWKTIDVADNR